MKLTRAERLRAKKLGWGAGYEAMAARKKEAVAARKKAKQEMAKAEAEEYPPGFY